MKKIALRSILALLSCSLLSLSGRSVAQVLPPFLTGHVEVSAVQAEVDDEHRNTRRESYRLSLRHLIAGNLQFQASGRYAKFDVESAELNGTLREEFQPSANLLWKHTHFVLSSSAYRRDLSLINSDGSVITDDFRAGIRTHDPEHPIAELRYGWQKIRDEASVSARDSRDWRLEASLSEDFDWQRVRYAYLHRVSENLISGLEVTQNAHLFRWSAAQTPLDTDRLRLGANYSFSHRDQRDDIVSGDGIIEPLSILAGLYLRDASPDVGELDRESELNDQILDRGVDPPIDLGGGNQDHNVGADLGFARVSSTIYIYVDRQSGDRVRWDIYSSEDNLDWDPEATLSSSYNAGLRRYEIHYSPVEARYVKAVSSGINDVTRALVSELEVFGPVPETPGRRRSRNAHIGDLIASYRFDERWSSSLDLSYRHQPAQGSEGKRRTLDYAVRTDFDQSPRLSHALRWEQALQRFGAERPRIRDDGLSYSAFFDPLTTISLTGSASARFEKIGSDRTREGYSLLGEATGEISRTLTALNSFSVNRLHLYNQKSRTDSWTYRASVRADVTRWLTTELGWSHQQANTHPMDRLRVRSTVLAAVDMRVTPTIFLRGRFNEINDVGDNVQQDYLLSWRLAPNLTLSGQAILSGFGDGQSTTQYTASLNYDINPRSALFLRYSSIDTRDAEGTLTDSFQQGFRAAL